MSLIQRILALPWLEMLVAFGATFIAVVYLWPLLLAALYVLSVMAVCLLVVAAICYISSLGERWGKELLTIAKNYIVGQRLSRYQLNSILLCTLAFVLTLCVVRFAPYDFWIGLGIAAICVITGYLSIVLSIGGLAAFAGTVMILRWFYNLEIFAVPRKQGKKRAEQLRQYYALGGTTWQSPRQFKSKTEYEMRQEKNRRIRQAVGLE